MSCTRRGFVAGATCAGLLGLSACAQKNSEAPAQESKKEEDQQPKEEVDLKEFEALKLDMAAWSYDKKNDVYYQLGVPYCLKPASDAHESLAIFVPGAYLTPADDSKKPVYNVDEKATVGNYTPKTAPVVMPINSGTLGAQFSPTSYSYAGLETYLAAGYVYVYAGFRGRSSGFESASSDVFSGGAPWPVVDLKAAIRFLRYNAESLPCDPSRVFTFGFSAGGGISAVMGCAGDSELYTPYLEQIGAATHDAKGATLSDATFGSASWCPITSYDTADASYEWMMGQYASDGTRAEGTWTKLFSQDLACRYAEHVNDLDLRDGEDQRLELDETSGDLFADGSYYTHMLNCIQDAAAKFFSTTQFPYTYTPQHLVNASFPGDPNLQSVGAGTDDVEAVTGDASAQAAGITPTEEEKAGKSNVQSVVYNSDVDYVNDLNGNETWLTYNQMHATVRISSVGDFVRHLKTAAKGVGAFDAFDRSSVTNQLFGTEEVSSLHFSELMGRQLSVGRDTYAVADDWRGSYVDDWATDLTKVDNLKTDMMTRVRMFSPLYYLSSHYEGAGKSKVAPHWRINSGLFQTDTSLCTELNLALALGHNETVSDVAFTPVWGQGHVLAEVTGTAEANFVDWVATCCGTGKE